LLRKTSQKIRPFELIRHKKYGLTVKLLEHSYRRTWQGSLRVGEFPQGEHLKMRSSRIATTIHKMKNPESVDFSEQRRKETDSGF
jgi:hypothetical protein